MKKAEELKAEGGVKGGIADSSTGRPVRGNAQAHHQGMTAERTNGSPCEGRLCGTLGIGRRMHYDSTTEADRALVNLKRISRRWSDDGGPA